MQRRGATRRREAPSMASGVDRRELVLLKIGLDLPLEGCLKFGQTGLGNAARRRSQRFAPSILHSMWADYLLHLVF